MNSGGRARPVLTGDTRKSGHAAYRLIDAILQEAINHELAPIAESDPRPFSAGSVWRTRGL
jgi:hypothetical protein